MVDNQPTSWVCDCDQSRSIHCDEVLSTIKTYFFCSTNTNTLVYQEAFNLFVLQNILGHCFLFSKENCAY